MQSQRVPGMNQRVSGTNSCSSGSIFFQWTRSVDSAKKIDCGCGWPPEEGKTGEH